MIKREGASSLMLGEVMRKKGYKNNFSAIKIIAACMVVIAHSFPLSGATGDPLTLVTKGRLDLGGLAVQLFFSISGFLITSSVFRMFQKKHYKNFKEYVIYFFKRRCLRLFPSLVIVNFFVYFLIVPIFLQMDDRIGYFLRMDPYVYFMRTSFLSIVYRVPHLWVNNPLATEINGSLWTCPVEFMCYIAIFFGIIFGFLGKVCHHPNNLGDSFTEVQIRNSRHFLENFGMLCMFFIFLFQPFLHSCILELCLLYYFSSLYYVYREKIILSWKLFIIIFVICVVFYYFNFGVYTIIFLPYLVFYLAYAMPQFLFLNRLGNYSYECYLVAFPIQQGWIFFEGAGHPWRITFLTLPLMFFVAVGINQIKDRLLFCEFKGEAS